MKSLSWLLLFLSVPALSTTRPNLAEEQAKVNDLFQQVQAQQEVVTELQGQLGSSADNRDQSSNQAAGEAPSSTDIKNRLAEGTQALSSLQDQIDAAKQQQTDKYINDQDGINEDNESREQVLKSTQSDLSEQSKKVNELNTFVKDQQATHLDSNIFRQSLEEQASEQAKLQDFQSLYQYLQVQAQDDATSELWTRDQDVASSEDTVRSLQQTYAEQQKSYQQLETQYDVAVEREQKVRDQQDAVTSDYQVQHEKLLVLEDQYSKEQQNLSAMEAQVKAS
jgi:putative ABC transport system permease protein